jgi:hypothetical protein
MRRILLLALPVVAALACKPSAPSTSVEPEPDPAVQPIAAPELEGTVPITCDGTNAAIVWRDGVIERQAIPMAAFEAIYSLKLRKYTDRGREIPKTADRRYHLAISDRLINLKLLELECGLVGVDYDEAAVAEREVAQKRGIEDWEAHLRRRGESEDSLRQLLIGEQRERSLLVHEGKLEVTTEQVAREYERIRPETVDDEVRIRVSHILVEVLDPADEAAALARAQELYARASSGEDFAALAREQSDDPSPSKGGDLGIVTDDAMEKAFAKVAFKLKPGEISKPVRTQFGFHIIAVFGRYPAGELPFEALEQDIRQRLMSHQLHQGPRDLRDRLRAEYEFENCIPALMVSRGLDP